MKKPSTAFLVELQTAIKGTPHGGKAVELLMAVYPDWCLQMLEKIEEELDRERLSSGLRAKTG